MRNWIAYIAILGFTAYWASNLILWFPWSYSEALGITLMLTVTPVLWAYVTFLGLRTYPRADWIRGASWISVVFLLLGVSMDYVFFGLIRGAMQELYQPTTFYGYVFLLAWPFLLGWLLRSRMPGIRKEARPALMWRALLPGLLCLMLLSLILLLE